MKRWLQFFCLILFVSLFITSINVANAQGTSLSLLGGIGLPTGWWGERWDLTLNGEINVHYDIAPGMGLMLMTGMGKGYLGDLSPADISADSRLRGLPPEFASHANVTYANQSGSFKQIPIGIGVFAERLIAILNTHQLRGYGSFALVVQLWNADRYQYITREIDVPNMPLMTHTDNWSDKVDGSDVGAQVGLGLLYQMQKNLFLDLSAAYQYLDIGKDNSAIMYWGLPGRLSESDDRKPDSNRIDLLQLRFGLRYTL